MLWIDLDTMFPFGFPFLNFEGIALNFYNVVGAEVLKDVYNLKLNIMNKNI